MFLPDCRHEDISSMCVYVMLILDPVSASSIEGEALTDVVLVDWQVDDDMAVINHLVDGKVEAT